MSLVVIGANHRSAPLELLERLSVAAADAPKALGALVSNENVSEAAVLSTCNRIEVYAVAERFHRGFSDIRGFFADASHVLSEDFIDHLYVRYDDEAVAHLFRVAAGIDSAVLGESEILGQVKDAWELARVHDAAGPVLNLVFRHAIEVGKRARSETGIARSITSISQAAVAMATDRLGTLSGRDVLVLGAGEMGEGMAVALSDSGGARITVANRTPGRADDLAARIGGTAIALGELPAALGDVDVMLTSTGAASIILEYADLEHALAARDRRPLLIVDIAVPRDVDPGVADLDGVTLLDMDDLTAFAESGQRERAGEVSRVEKIIGDEVTRFADVRSARELDPLVTALRRRAEAVRRVELDRRRSSLDGLTDEQREAVEALTRGIVAKLLHDPTIAVKDAAGTPKGDRLADSLRDLFGL